MTPMPSGRAWLRAAVELLFPPFCLLCGGAAGENGGGICGSCLAAVPFCRPPYCRCCGVNFSGCRDTSHLCEACLRRPPPFAGVRAITFYEEPVRTLLHRLKYGYDTTALGPLLEIAQSFDISRYDSCDWILPVPMHRARLKRRGMNQALVLARGIFEGRLADVRPSLVQKCISTPAQMGLDGRARRANLKAAFSVKNDEILRGKRICLVDDIVTTGTTAAECSRALRRGGAQEVQVLAFARVRR